MAYDACDCHATSFRGKSNFAYPAEIRQGTRSGRRVRLCPRGQEELLASARKHLDEMIEGSVTGRSGEPVCGWCGELGPAEPTARIYLTCYRDHKDRLDYSGWACSRCLSNAESELILRPLGAPSGPS